MYIGDFKAWSALKITPRRISILFAALLRSATDEPTPLGNYFGRGRKEIDSVPPGVSDYVAIGTPPFALITAPRGAFGCGGVALASIAGVRACGTR